MKKLTVLALCGLFLCLLLFGCKEREKEISATYWEAVNVAPVNSGQTPATWKLVINDAKTVVDVEQELNKKILELLKNNRGYCVASSKINLEIEVTLAPEK